MMRLLILGDLASTGFGTVTADLGLALLARGLDVRFLSQNRIDDDLPEPFASRTLRVPEPDFITKQTDQVIQVVTGAGFPDGWTPEVMVLIADYLGAEMVVSRAPQAFSTIPTLHYVPIEGGGLPPSWKTLWDIVEPVACSEFGRREIAKVVGHDVAMAYHGVDRLIYHPARRDLPLRMADNEMLRSKGEAKRRLHADPNRIMVLRTDRNMPRKRFGSMLRAMTPVLQAHPNVDLVLHCRSFDQGGNLDHAVSKLPASIRSQVIVTDVGGGLSRDMLAAMYNAADVYLSTGSEGFGLTIAEAIACGTPAVGIDYSAVPEVIGPAGAIVPIGGLVDNEYDHFWGAVDETALTDEMLRLVTSRTRRERLGALGPAHVKRNFSWAEAARVIDVLASQRLGRVAA